MKKYTYIIKCILLFLIILTALPTISQEKGLINEVIDNNSGCGYYGPWVYPNNVIDGDFDNCFQPFYECDIDISIKFNYSIDAAKIDISSNKNGIKIFIPYNGETIHYHTTTTESFYIISPTGFDEFTLRLYGNPPNPHRICNINITEIELGEITANYDYDNAGNMTEHTFIILGSEANKLSNLYEYEYPESHIDKEVTDDDIPPFTDEIDDNKISIYPNPTKGELKVDIEMGDLEYANNIFISVHDASGRKILSKNATNTGTTLNLSNQSPGLYILTVTIDNNSKQWKIIKE